MQVQKVIELLGYSAKEAKVYLAVLALGESHVSDIAEMVKLPRTSVQIVLEKLLQDQLVNFYVMRRYKYWTAENPERILSTLIKKENIIRETLPQLISLKKENRSKRYSRNTAHSFGILKMLADTTNVPVLVTDKDARIMYVNQKWEDLFGYSLEEISGENPKILQSKETPREAYIDMWESLKCEKLFQSDKIIDKKKDGTLFTLLTTILPIRHNKNIFYIQMLTDTTQGAEIHEAKKVFHMLGNQV